MNGHIRCQPLAVTEGLWFDAVSQMGYVAARTRKWKLRTRIHALAPFRTLRLLPSEHAIHCRAGGQYPRTPRERGEVPRADSDPRERTRLDEKYGNLSEFTYGDHEAEVAKPRGKRS